MKTKQWDMGKGEDTGDDASCVFMNDQIHLILGMNKHHLMYNVKKNEWTKSIAITAESVLQYCAINKCSKPNTLFVMGGEISSDTRDKYKSSDMFEILISENKSNIVSKHQLPVPLSCIGTIFVKPYILFFGGYTEEMFTYTNAIYSFDIYQYKWRQCMIKTPSEGRYWAVLLNNQVHLIEMFSNKKHYSINLDVLLNAKWIDLTIGDTTGVNEPIPQISDSIMDQKDNEQILAESNVAQTVAINNQNKIVSNDELELIWDAMKKIQKENESLKESNKNTQIKLESVMDNYKELKNKIEKIELKLANNDDEKKEEIDELKMFLTDNKYKVNLIQYYNVFKEQGFEEMDVLIELTDQDLSNDLKINKKAHRLKILRGIKILNQQVNNNNNIVNDINIAPPAVYVDGMIDGPHVLVTKQ
eukprot:249624_1